MVRWPLDFDESISNLYCILHRNSRNKQCFGWLGGAMALGKPPVMGCPTNLDDSKARAYCAYGRCRWGLFGYFFSHLSFLSSFSISLGDGPI